MQQEAPRLPENTPKYRKRRVSFLPGKGKEKYRNQLRRMNDPEREKELKEQAKAISAELKPLREDLRMAKRIEEKYPQLQQLLETERDMETRVRTRERERGYER